MSTKTPFQKWCDTVSQAEVARLLDVRPAAVSHWYSGRRRLTPERCLQIEQVTKGALSRKTLDPEVFG